MTTFMPGTAGLGAWLLGTTILAMSLSLPVQAQTAGTQTAQAESQQRFRFDIAAKPLPQALADFGAVTGLRIVYTAEQPFSLIAKPVSGNLTAAEALARLLADSGFTYRFTNATTVTLVEAPRGSGAAVLPPVTVQGQQDRSAAPYYEDYGAVNSSSVTKTSTPLVETPQSISVVTRAQIEDQGSQTVMQAMRYTPGAFTGQVGASNRYDYVVLRGFVDRSIDNVYLNGLKMMGDDQTYSSFQIDPYFLDRIDAVRGPASVLYGRSSPGGLIALTSKKPLFENYREVEATLGNRRQRGAGFDFSGPLSDRLAYRVTGMADAQDTQFDHTEEQRYAIAPSLTMRSGDDTTLTLMAYLHRDPEGGTHNGAPRVGTLVPRNGQFISRHFFDGEPNLEKFDRKQTMVGYEFEHRFDDTFTMRQNLRYVDASVRIDQVYHEDWIGATNQLARSYFGGDETLNALAVDNQLQAELATGGIQHTVLGGLDYQHRRSRNNWMYHSVSAIDPFNPAYNNYTVGPATLFQATRGLEQTGIYLQDQLAWENWRLTLGGRQDWADTSNLNRLTNVRAAEEREKFTKRGGLLYLFENGVAPYISYSESFSPNIRSGADGRPLKPTEGVQYEGGVKFQPPGSRSLISGAVFQIDQENLAVTRTGGAFAEPIGSVRSRGLELESQLQVSDSLKLLAAYTYIKAELTSSPDGNEGNQPAQVPGHMASLWGDYTFQSGTMKALSLGAGVRYVGESWTDPRNYYRVPSSTVVDMSLRYDLAQIGMQGAQFRLNVNNLFDKTYFTSCLESAFSSNCYFGEERTITGTLSYKF